MRLLRGGGREGPARPGPADGPTVWVQLGGRDPGLLPPLAARVEALAAAPVRLLVTGDPHPLDRITRVPTPPADRAAAFVAEQGISALAWAEGALDPLLLDAAGVPVVVLPSWAETCRTAPGPLARRALGQVLEGQSVLVGGHAALRRVQRDVRGGYAAEVTGPLQEGPALPPDDEARRARLTAALEGRPVWFAAAVPPDRQRDFLAAQSEIVSRSHRALLVMESEDGVTWEPAETPGAQERMLRATGPEERGLWHRIASVTVMGDSFDPGGRTDPLVPAALGSAVVHGPATGVHGRGYARLHASGGARRAEGVGAIAGAVESLLAPDRAAAQASAAWEEVTRGAEATDRVAALLIEALERTGAL